MRSKPYCNRHRTKYRTYFDGVQSCPKCEAERAADPYKSDAQRLAAAYDDMVLRILLKSRIRPKKK